METSNDSQYYNIAELGYIYLKKIYRFKVIESAIMFC